MKPLVKKGALLAVVAALLLAGAATFLANVDHGKPPTWPDALEEYLGTPAYKTVDLDKPLDEQTSVFEIAGRTFEMPTVYIQSDLGEERTQPDGVNLIYVLPDYRSRGDFVSRQQYAEAREERRTAHMMLEPSALRSSFDVMIGNLRRSVTKIEEVGLFDGLQAERWYRRRGDKLLFYSEVYIEKGPAGQVVSWINCATKERGAVTPGCSHHFRDKGILYQIYYNKANYLADWRKQRASAIAFIDSFEITHNDNNKGD